MASAVPPWLIERQRGLGGAEGTRTPYLNTASVALSRMSYSPKGTRRGIDPLDGPITEATRRRLAVQPGSPPRLTGEFGPILSPCTSRRLANSRAYYSQSQQPEDSRGVPKVSNADRAAGWMMSGACVGHDRHADDRPPST